MKPKNYSNNMRKNPKISVVIPAFNEEKFLPKCLESLKNQDFKDFEMIVVDNNSTDKTVEIAKKFGAIVFSEKNQGVAFARQKGFLKARGKIIASTDADTILSQNWLSRIFEEFQRDESLLAFGGSCILYSGPFSAKLAARYFFPFLLRLDKIFSGGWNLMGSNFAVRKSAFLKIGGFNTNLKLNEDIEISHRLRKVGKVILDPNFKVKTSGRRYRHGLIFGLINYAPSTIFRFLFKKYDKFQNFPPVRKEESLIGKFSFPIISLFVFLFLLFHLSTPKMVLAHQNFVPKNLGGLAKNLIKKDFNKAVFVEKRIKNGVKNDFLEIKNFENGKKKYSLLSTTDPMNIL
jgi:glycosyltransferase involved in cell wall biosynthesis